MKLTSTDLGEGGQQTGLTSHSNECCIMEKLRVAAASTAIKAHRQLAKTCTLTPWRRNTGNLVAGHMLVKNFHSLVKMCLNGGFTGHDS